MNPQHVLTTFSTSSSKSTLQNHLIQRHKALWVQGCDRLKISIKTDTGLAAVERVQGIPPNEYLHHRAPAQPFSNVAFVDAIVVFIVGDDLVLFAILLYYLMLIL